VGLTAGTSTLPRTIEEVHGWLLRLATADGERGDEPGSSERRPA
jgi:hypothetical protein